MHLDQGQKPCSLALLEVNVETLHRAYRLNGTSPVVGVDMNAPRWIVPSVLILFLAAGCGGGGGAVDVVDVGRVTITYPSDTGVYTTDQAFVSIRGKSFAPASFVSGSWNTWPPLQGNPLCELTDRYRVTAVNEVAGTKLPPVVGEANWVGGYVEYPGPTCVGTTDPTFSFFDLPLQPGTNRITVKVREDDRFGTATIVIERTV
jgi:hypothetical protein